MIIRKLGGGEGEWKGKPKMNFKNLYRKTGDLVEKTQRETSSLKMT